MMLRWNNGYLVAGPLLYQNAFGIELAWGLRSLLEGREPESGETIFADHKTIIIATRRDVAIYGSVWKAALVRIFRGRFR